MKRIMGFVIAYPPLVLSPSDGLARLLSFLVRGGIESGIKIIIICPEWSRKELDHLLKDAEIDFSKDQVEIISTGQIPPFLTLHSKFLRWQNRPRRMSSLGKFFFLSKKIVSDLIVWIGGTSSWIILIVVMIATILLSPLFIIAGLLYILAKIILQASNKTPLQSIEKRIQTISKPLQAYTDDLFARRIFNAINHNEVKKLTALARNKNSIHSWLIPTPFWPDLIKQLPHTVVVCPDVVISEFPVGFESVFRNRVVERRSQVKESLDAASHLITYSNYVKNFHIKENFAIADDKISVIPHGYITLEHSLNILKPFKTMSPREQDDHCLQIVHDYLYEFAEDPYLRNFNFFGVRFLFYTSQIRPSKNVNQLIKAFYQLLHKRHEPIKLILTGNPNDDPSTMNLVSTLGLERDVLFLPSIPTRVMAALYHLSTVAVNPTLFEGGFPFTFSEAYSVGTPSIMSCIPVVQDFVTDPDLQKKMLFDPYNIDDMVEHIYWGLHHREELFNSQQLIYYQLQNRSWALVAEEYMDVLDRVDKNWVL